MSDHEKEAGGVDCSVVMDQTTASRHMQPIRSMDIQEASMKDLPHKRSKTPFVALKRAFPDVKRKRLPITITAIPRTFRNKRSPVYYHCNSTHYPKTFVVTSHQPAVVEESKDNQPSKINIENKDKNATERGLSPEKNKMNVVKKLSSVVKRLGSSPDNAIKSASNAVKESNPGQPIPEQVTPDTQIPLKKVSVTKKKSDEDDSITDEVGELRTPKAAKSTSEWIDTSGIFKKKGVSWDEDDYLLEVKLQDKSDEPCLLEKKSSLGPCFYSAVPFGRPSGISICLAKKCLVKKTIYWDVKEFANPRSLEIPVKSKGFLRDTMKEKISFMTNKLKNVFDI